MKHIVIISGSPSALSRTEQMLYYLGRRAEQQGFAVKHLSVKDVEAEVLLSANFNHDKIKAIATELEAADGVIIGSPVYKASYSGVLKALFDLLPPDILKDTYVLPVMTGGSTSHLLALEYALKPLIATVKGHNLKGLYFQDSDIDKTADKLIVNENLRQRTERQLAYFLGKIQGHQDEPIKVGHRAKP